MSEKQIYNKIIENHIKGLLFNNKNATGVSPPVQSSHDMNYNMQPYMFNDKTFLSHKTDAQEKDKLSSLMPLDSSFCKQPGSSSSSSQLIDVNVLTDFAAKHASINDVSNSSGILPHPDLENDSLASSPGTHIAKNTVLNYIASAQEENKISKFPHYSEIPIPPPVDSLKYAERNCNRSEGPNESERNSSDKRKRSVKKRKQNIKEKGNRKTPVMHEMPVDKPMPSPQKDSPRQEIMSANKRLSQREGTPEIRKEHGYKYDSESNQQLRFPDEEFFAPMPTEEVLYTVSTTKDGFKLNCHICNYEANSRDYMYKHLTSENHKELKDQLLADRVLPFLPKPLPAQIESINELLMKCYAEHGLQKEDLVLRENIANRLIEFTNQHLTGCNVDMIGSSVTGLGLKNSKVDFVLKVAQEQNIPDCLELLYKKLLSDPSYTKVESDFKKKRLGILFSDKESGLDCSIILENAFSEKFARLFALYYGLDPRVKYLGACLRYWARICELDNPDRGTLPPFTFSILLIYFLQQTDPPVLPVIHELKEYGNANFIEKYIKGNEWKSENECSVAELWINFFYFYNFDYELGKHVICIRSSEKVLCSEKNWSTKFYAIEDPFSRRNIAHVIPNYPVYQYIQQCFLRTFRYFAFPQTVNGAIKLYRTEEYDGLLSSYASAKFEARERDYSDNESVHSDNEDSSIPDDHFEDHDPDIPIENMLSTLKHMSIEENKSPLDGEMTEGPPDQATSLEESSVKVNSPQKEAKINREKLIKAQERAKIQSACSWDLKDLPGVIKKELLEYKMDPSLFKSRKEVPYSCKQCKSPGHLKKDCPKDGLPSPKLLPKMTAEFLRFTSKMLFYIRDKNCVDELDKEFMSKHMKEIELYIQKVFPGANLSMFGSFCNGFGFKSRSDMDFCLTFKDVENSKELNSSDVIEKLAKHLSLHPRLENIVAVTSAKVPIVKFACGESGLEGDISLYNTLALVNTEMLELYSKIDERVQILGFALKYFAKVLGICDASRGSLSSYAYILMVIFFLQQRDPPVIPVLQELHGEEKPTHLVDGWNVWYFKDLDKLPEVWLDYGKNQESSAELWQGLLSFYAYNFDWKEYVVSIKQKALLTRFRKLWITEQIAIEDPFDLNHNLGAGLSHKMNMYIMRTFIRGRERFGTPLSTEDYMSLQGHELNYLFDRRFLNSGTEPPHDRGCRKCGKIGHLAKNCVQEKLCSYCRKPGHLVRNCPQKRPKLKAKHMDKNSQETFSKNRNSMDVQNLQGHSLRIQNSDMQRTNNHPFNMPPKNSDERDPARKLLQMGFPTHRHPHPPPPGFPKTFTNPPPGFKAMPPNSTKFPRFSSNCPAPFPRLPMPMNNSQSPPKHFSCSPPKSYLSNNMYHPDSIPSIGIRPELHMSPSDPMLHRMWQNHQMPNRMPQQHTDRRKRTN